MPKPINLFGYGMRCLLILHMSREEVNSHIATMPVEHRRRVINGYYAALRTKRATFTKLK